MLRISKRLLARIAIFLGGFGFVAGSTLFVLAYFTVDIPNPNDFVNTQSTIIQYSNGSEIGRIGAQNRTIVPLAKIPLHLRQAVLAAENRNFYSEHAFSFSGFARAVIDNVKTLGRGGGGSTITQQYAKTAFLTQERTITRKIKELVIAIKLENQLSKDQILENYLNTIYFGRGSYGVETAAQQYFNRSAKQLNLAQSAVIASILRSPGYYDPQYSENNMKRLQARFQYVLDGMVKAGWVDEAKAKSTKFPTIMPGTSEGWLSGPKGYLIEMVRAELVKRGFTDDQLMKGGLIVKTTFDQKAQTSAVAAVAKLTPKGAPENLHIGLVAIRPGTGEIIALYGGADYVKRQLNDATQLLWQVLHLNHLHSQPV